MNCRSVQKSLSAYIDKELDNETSEKISGHLLECTECNTVYNRLDKTNSTIASIYLETELPEGYRQELISKTDQYIDSENTEPNIFLNFAKRLYQVYIGKKRLVFGTCGVFILFVFVFLNWEAVSNRLMKGHPGYILEEKQFNSIESAQKSINQIPFLIPQKIKTSYKLENITYSMDKGNSRSVVFNYEDKDKNRLRIEYYSRGDNAESQSDFSIVNPDIVRVQSDGSYNAVPPGTTPTEKDMLTIKESYLELADYSISIILNYSGHANESDKSDDEMIAGIIEGFLHSQIFYANDKNNGVFNSQTIKYNSFSEFKQNVPLQSNINEPKYIPKGFNFKYIIYKGRNNSPDYNIAAIYENDAGIQLTVDYMTVGASSRYGNNNDKFAQRSVYRIQPDENGKGDLIPYTERQYGHQFSSFDMNIYLQYKTGTFNYDYNYDNELKKIVESLE